MNMSDSAINSESYKRMKKDESKIRGMGRRAERAEVILLFVIVMIVNCACILYCKLRNKKKTDEALQVSVNETVSQYFALAQDDSSRPTQRSSDSQN